MLVTEKAPEYSPRALRVLERSVQEAENQKEAQAGTEHLLVAMLKETDCVATRLLFLEMKNISLEEFFQILQNYMSAFLHSFSAVASAILSSTSEIDAGILERINSSSSSFLTLFATTLT